MFNHVSTLIIDFDGTIHDSLHIYEPAFRNAYQYLIDNQHVPNRNWKSSEISQFLGQTPAETWNIIGQGLSDGLIEKASQMIGSTMSHLIEEGNAKLYDGALDVLRTLRNRGYILVFLSNCKRSYMEKHTKWFKLNEIFHTMLCGEDFSFISKAEIIRQISDSYPQEIVVIGDRHHDIDAGIANHLKTIGCTYGFGELKEISKADILIYDIKELLSIFPDKKR